MLFLDSRLNLEYQITTADVELRDGHDFLHCKHTMDIVLFKHEFMDHRFWIQCCIRQFLQ